jgi:small subunit ribosomal protein S21
VEELSLGKIMAGKPINVEIYVRRGDSVDRAIRRFNKKVKKLGILEDFIKRRFYEKPSATRNRRNRLRKRIIEKENQARKEEENNFYKPKSKRRRSRR